MDDAPETVGMIVRVRELPLLADIGINPDEIGRRQPLVISVELQLAVQGVQGIHDTIDYRRIVRAAEALATVHIPLIETFAERLAGECLSWTPVSTARISVDKPFALTRGTAGVEVIRRRTSADAKNMRAGPAIPEHGR